MVNGVCPLFGVISSVRTYILSARPSGGVTLVIIYQIIKGHWGPLESHINGQINESGARATN